MTNLKKSALVILALSTSGAAMAGTMGPVCEPGNATVPCEMTAWDVGITAFNVRPSYDADKAYFNTYTNAQFHTAHRNESLDWGWGFRLEGSYHFNTGNDFNVNWYHFDNTTTKDYLVGNVFLQNGTFDQAYKDKITWDAVNFEFAQHVDFGEHKNIRFHGGAQYASIKSDGSIMPLSQGFVSYYHSMMKFDGFGPRAGADMSYDLPGGFAIYMNTAAALLYGTSDFSSALSNDGLTSANGSKDHLVPQVEAKIGGKYTMPLAQGMVSVDGGWMWVNYFNALHGQNLAGAALVETDFSVHGPYFGVKWVGNV